VFPKNRVSMSTINEDRFIYIVHFGIKVNGAIFDDAIYVLPEDVAANL
jgi:hypothetical protein